MHRDTGKRNSGMGEICHILINAPLTWHGAASVHDRRLSWPDDMAVRGGAEGGGGGMGGRYGEPPFVLPAHGGWIGSGHHEMARFISDEANGRPSATAFEAGTARDQGAHFDSAVTSPTFIDFLGVGAT